ncbi:hypothetical protein [Bradyrhizobium sp. SYSU BS000235]|uniref:hypothetical protein n=1 Tax=Bradyrhizobium sp. SYSU BS000235 TaxID=3411332 RepID=UPI003C747E15
MKSPVKIAAACVVLALGSWMAVSPAAARPPTATTSPGYDRALIESRKALQPTTPDMKAVPRKRSKHGQRPH